MTHDAKQGGPGLTGGEASEGQDDGRSSETGYAVPASSDFKVHKTDDTVFTDSAFLHHVKTFLAKLSTPRTRIRMEAAMHELGEFAGEVGSKAANLASSAAERLKDLSARGVEAGRQKLEQRKGEQAAKKRRAWEQQRSLKRSSSGPIATSAPKKSTRKPPRRPTPRRQAAAAPPTPARRPTQPTAPKPKPAAAPRATQTSPPAPAPPRAPTQTPAAPRAAQPSEVRPAARQPARPAKPALPSKPPARQQQTPVSKPVEARAPETPAVGAVIEPTRSRRRAPRQRPRSNLRATATRPPQPKHERQQLVGVKRAKGGRVTVRRFRLMAIGVVLILIASFWETIGAPVPDLLSSLFSSVSLPEFLQPSEAGTGRLATVRGWIDEGQARLTERISGPLVIEGARIAVADLTTSGGVPEAMGHSLALVIEEELAQSAHFTVLRRERVRTVVAPGEKSGIVLSATQALASLPAANITALVTGEITADGDSWRLSIMVLGQDGETMHEAGGRLSPLDPVTSLGPVTASLRRRLGDTKTAIQASLTGAQVFGSERSALMAYARARAELYNGNFKQAREAAREALSHDSALAVAARVLADGHALAGRKKSARTALGYGWNHKMRLIERERLRLGADRQAFAGRREDAINAYRRMLAHFPDDLQARKSLAVLLLMQGERRATVGDLTLSSSVDVADWPPLARVGRFHGYRGSLEP